MRFAPILVLCALAWACSESRPSRCDTICRREANCAEQLNDESEGADELEVDESECVEQCRRLEKDADGAKLVEDHALCVDQAATCPAVLACQ